MRYNVILFVTASLWLPSFAFATVGGPQNIEVLGLDQADQKVYLMRHYLDGRGRLPQLYYYQLNRTQTNSKQSPVKLIEVKSLYINPKTKRIDYDQNSQKFDREIAKIKKRLKPLTPIRASSAKIQILSKKTVYVASWFDPEIKVPQFSYTYRIRYGKYKSPVQKAVDYKTGLSISQRYQIPQHNKVLMTVKYLGIPFETGYSIEDPMILTP
ncbi:aminotransferase [Acinetobacter towneri]|uniref:aminotransferase n=1 Tax=Acinetobacter towneri TaxID=202956 RepID=UPI002DB857EE|nr:aminotransferase [Acinetobacter towneri]MEB6564658.1 aminotransferase [Acinetobacter towneri]